jgi:lysophospholipase
MPLAAAPFQAALARHDGAAEAFWLTARDGLRLRAALFRAETPRGTVLLFPGRTEYAEKYGPAAQALNARGFDVVAIDWRGQGLSQRLLADPLVGHVDRFTDYQHDVAALREAVRVLGLPGPLHMIAHSMGGCIGLRAAMDGLDVESCVFTGPMWGIRLSAFMRPAAWAVAWSSRLAGFGHRLSPGTGAVSYLANAEFEDNTLTTDRAMWDMMRAQVAAVPEFGLGGPSLHWLHEALRECRLLARRPSPPQRCLCVAGGNERIVDPMRIRARMARWPGGRLEVLEGKEHEIMMEDAATREALFDSCARLFDEAGNGVAA